MSRDHQQSTVTATKPIDRDRGKQFTPEAREALWRCYELILEYGRKQEQDEEVSEDADEFADQAASPESSTVEAEYSHIVPSLSRSSSDRSE